MGLTLNANPNHDELGKFSSGDTVKLSSRPGKFQVHMVKGDELVLKHPNGKSFFGVKQTEASLHSRPAPPTSKSTVDTSGKSAKGFPAAGAHREHVEKASTDVMKTFSSLSKAQKDALTAHTGSGTTGVQFSQLDNPNDLLRAGGKVEDLSGGPRRVAELLKSSMQEFDKPVLTYRGVSGGEQSSVKEAVRQQFMANLDRAANTGGVITMNGFTSTSISPSAAVGFAHKDGPVFEIKQKRGVWAAPNSAYKDQREIIADHGAKYRVVGKTHGTFDHPDTGQKTTRQIYQMEEL